MASLAASFAAASALSLCLFPEWAFTLTALTVRFFFTISSLISSAISQKAPHLFLLFLDLPVSSGFVSSSSVANASLSVYTVSWVCTFDCLTTSHAPRPLLVWHCLFLGISW